MGSAAKRQGTGRLGRGCNTQDFLYIVPVAFGAFGLLIPPHQELEISFALVAVVFIDRHLCTSFGFATF